MVLLNRAVRSMSFLPYHDKPSACAATCSRLSTLPCSDHIGRIYSYPILGRGPGFQELLHRKSRLALETPDELLLHSWSQVPWIQLDVPFQGTFRTALLCLQWLEALWVGHHHHGQSWSLSRGELVDILGNLIIWGTCPVTENRIRWSSLWKAVQRYV